MGKKSRRPQRQHHHQKNHPATTLTGDSTTAAKTMGTSSSKAASGAAAAAGAAVAAASVPPPGSSRRSKGDDRSEVGKVKETTTSTSLTAPTTTVSVEEQATSGGSTHAVPEGLTAFLPKMTDSQQKLALDLCSEGQEHLFEGWSTTITEEEEDAEMTTKKKKEMMEQLEALDQSYPDGGLKGYLTNARVLLEKSRRGINPLDGWTPSIPQGQTFHLGTSHYDETEAIGIPYLGKCAFVLVAGGLGERLGYSDIKVRSTLHLTTVLKYLFCRLLDTTTYSYIHTFYICPNSLRLDYPQNLLRKPVTLNSTYKLFWHFNASTRHQTLNYHSAL